MNQARFEFLKEIVLFFRERPEATHYLGVSKETCSSLLALHFSSPEETLDPTTLTFQNQIEEKIKLFEENFNQKQSLPPTETLPAELETATQDWQEEAAKEKPLPQHEAAGRLLEGKLKDTSLKAWKKINPEWTAKIGQFLGKGKALGKAVGVLGKVAGTATLALAAVGLSAEIIKKAVKYLGIPLLALYSFFAALGTGALVGFLAGGAVGGIAGGIGGAILGAKAGAALGAAIGSVVPGVGTAVGAVIGGIAGGVTGFIVGALAGANLGALIGGVLGYAIEHWLWKPVQAAWTGVGNFFATAWSGFWMGVGNFLSGALTWAGGTITATGSFFAGLWAQFSGISLAPAATIPVFGATIGAGAVTFWLGTSIVGTAFMRQPASQVGQPPTSQYIEVQKTVAPKSSFENYEIPTSITYAVSVSPKGSPLINVKITDLVTVTKSGSSPAVAPRSWTIPRIATPWSISYSLDLTEEFKDSAISNIVTVEADVEGGPTGQTAATGLTVTIGSPPASSCPIIGGGITCGSYGRDWPACRGGHGSNDYWAGLSSRCSYPLGGCYGPNYDTSSICYNSTSGCGTYGYAADIAGAPGTPVYLPAVGASLSWSYVEGTEYHSGQSVGEDWGWGRIYFASGGGKTYTLLLTHMTNGALNGGEGYVTNAPSGTLIGHVYNMSGSHVHLELQISGSYAKPEFLCQ